jgi:hypothetical protein
MFVKLHESRGLKTTSQCYILVPVTVVVVMVCNYLPRSICFGFCLDE